MTDQPSQLTNAANNTDLELWRTTPDDYYSKHKLFLTENGMLGLCEHGHCISMPPEDWFKLANNRDSTVLIRELVDAIIDLADLDQKEAVRNMRRVLGKAHPYLTPELQRELATIAPQPNSTRQ